MFNYYNYEYIIAASWMLNFKDHHSFDIFLKEQPFCKIIFTLFSALIMTSFTSLRVRSIFLLSSIRSGPLLESFFDFQKPWSTWTRNSSRLFAFFFQPTECTNTHHLWIDSHVSLQVPIRISFSQILQQYTRLFTNWYLKFLRKSELLIFSYYFTISTPGFLSICFNDVIFS